jgi:hypothetical protein
MGEFDFFHYIWPNGSKNILPDFQKHSNVILATSLGLKH